MSKIRVLSVDDSALMRQIMTEIINSHSDMEMVATAPDPLVARDLSPQRTENVIAAAATTLLHARYGAA